jgi:hypothetical protein
VVQSPNLISIVVSIFVDIIHAVDAVEVVFAGPGVGDDIPFRPRAIADGAYSGVGVGAGDVGHFARVSNVEVGILTQAEGRLKYVGIK